MQKLFRANITKHSATQKNLKNKVRFWIWFRVVCFLAMALLLYAYGGLWINLLVILALAVSFVFGVQKSAQVDQKLSFVKKLIEINQREMACLEGKTFGLSYGKEYIAPLHENAFDLDLLIPNGVFETLNRSATRDGQNQLAEQLLYPAQQPQIVILQQQAIKELAQMVNWRQEFMANGLSNGMEVMPQNKLLNDVESAPIINETFAKLLPFFPVLSLGVFVAFWIDVLTTAQFLLFLSIPLAFVGTKLKVIAPLIAKFEAIADHAAGLSAHLKAIEDTTFKSELLQRLQAELVTDNLKASKAFTHLNASLNSYYQRSNILIGIVLNAFFLWDIKHAHAIFIWQQNLGPSLPNWMKVIAQFDALNSLANFAHTRPNYIYPQVESQEPYSFEASDLKHPLLPQTTSVGNSFMSNKQGAITIVTGANMAGKSTFLRTLGVNIILASMGLPVSAKKMRFYPLRVFTSMRTNDSLANSSSFFHAEISRLAQLFEVTNTNQPRFVILDEILKGTNSEDKARGSYAFVKKLLHYNVMGVIATHDLSLCKLENEYPNKITNKSFEVLIENNELSFDYTLRNGVCKNLNASFLLKKMGLVDDY